MATIDVILPVRDGIRFLGEAIDSIRNQTFYDWRLLILDHGSSDGSIELAYKYADKDKRIEVFSFPEADGLGGLLNAGLDKCDCRYVMRQDSDDLAFSNRMELVNQAFLDCPKYVVVGGEAVLIDSSGRKINYLARPIGQQATTVAAFFYNSVLGAGVTINLPMFRKIGAVYGKDFIEVLPSSESIAVKQYAEDYFLFGQLALLRLCTNIGAPLIKYRIHDRNVSISNAEDQLKLSFSISRFLSKSFCRMNNLPDFDPVPFSNHGGHPFDVGNRDLSKEFSNMSESLVQGLGNSPEIRRELAFRWVLATRQPLSLLLRYARFELHYHRNYGERGVIRNWSRRILQRKKYEYSRNL
jgi:glycosyltransferase involved in cell wall biosynthesis